jgi:hypothetical protein
MQIRALATAVNSSPEQLASFKSIQDPGDRAFRDPSRASLVRVGLIQDAETRWGSTYDMLERALEMKITIRKWLNLDTNRRRYSMLCLRDEEWAQVDSLLQILAPFSELTTAIGTTLDVSVHEMFRLYNWLFEQLESAERKWKGQTRRVKYAEELVYAIAAARENLSEYYGRTDGDTEAFYSLASILNPTNKLTLYKVCTWLVRLFNLY